MVKFLLLILFCFKSLNVIAASTFGTYLQEIEAGNINQSNVMEFVTKTEKELFNNIKKNLKKLKQDPPPNLPQKNSK